jgi:hypothetical protein
LNEKSTIKYKEWKEIVRIEQEAQVHRVSVQRNDERISFQKKYKGSVIVIGWW